MNAAPRNRRAHLQFTKTQATNNFFAPHRHLLMDNAETGSEGNSTETLGTKESQGKASTNILPSPKRTTACREREALPEPCNRNPDIN
jgi:hypothetical protein